MIGGDSNYRLAVCVAGLLCMLGPPAANSAAPASAPHAAVDVAAASRFAALALTCLHQEYPNKIAHELDSDADVRAPRQLYPAFHGCYDWHSAVHGHWLLVRLIRQFPAAAFRAGGACRARAKPHARQPRGRSRVPAPTGARGVRTALRSRVAVAARGGTALVGTIPRPGTGPPTLRHSRPRPRLAFAAGCRISTTRFASASMIRPRLRSD